MEIKLNIEPVPTLDDVEKIKNEFQKQLMELLVAGPIPYTDEVHDSIKGLFLDAYDRVMSNKPHEEMVAWSITIEENLLSPLPR